jgi:hypothetical protein
VLVLTLAVAAAPAVLTACSLVCAAGDFHRSHSCHESQQTGTTSVTSGVHACGHSEELPTASGQVVPESAPAPALMPFVPPLALQASRVVLPFGFALSPPDRLSLTTQLRI